MSEEIEPYADFEILMIRENFLYGSDWTQLPDVSLSSEKKEEWTVFRQAWRDITKHERWPNLFMEDFPTSPS